MPSDCNAQKRDEYAAPETCKRMTGLNNFSAANSDWSCFDKSLNALARNAKGIIIIGKYIKDVENINQVL